MAEYHHEAREQFITAETVIFMNLTLLERMIDALQWYIDEDDVIEGMEGNEPWIEGRNDAIKILAEVNKELVSTTFNSERLVIVGWRNPQTGVIITDIEDGSLEFSEPVYRITK